MTARLKIRKYVSFLSLLLLVAAGLAFVGPGSFGSADAANVYDLDVSLSATYTYSQVADSGVGETRPELPEAPTLPESSPLPPHSSNGDNMTGGVFTFSVSCGATGSNCGSHPPTVEWDFGDGVTETTSTLTTTHAYATPGVYVVRAVATRGDWYGEERRTIYVSPHFADIENIVLYSETVLEPITYWRMNDTSGTTVTDSSSGGVHGIYSGSPTLNQDGAITAEGSASDGGNIATFFDGVDDVAVVAAPGVPVYGDAEHAVEAWLFIPSLPASDAGILNLGPTSGSGALEWVLTPAGQIRVGVTGGTSTPISIPTNEWFHFATSYELGSSNSLLSIYLNGAQARIFNPGAPVALTGALQIGHGQDSTAYFKGGVDEVAVYARRLGVTEISSRGDYTGDTPVTSSRDDRESIWTVGALDIFNVCDVAAQDVAEEVAKGRALFCPEPVVPDGLPANIAMPSGADKNGITEEPCTSWWGACNLPKELFDTALGPATASNINDLVSAGKLDASNNLVYDPQNCGDGWTAQSDGSGGWEIVPGAENGCLTRSDWYQTLVGAIDGYVDATPHLGENRLVADASASTCLDIAEAEANDPEGSFAYRRALALGLTTPTLRSDSQTGSGAHCDIEGAILKEEMYSSLGYVLGITTSDVCQDNWRDLYDEDLIDSGVRSEHPECGRIIQTVSNRKTPLVGDLECYWGTPAANGFCFNPYDPVSRGDAAILLAGTITQEAQVAGDLLVDLSQDGPKPVDSLITVTAIGRAPLSKYGDFQFDFSAVNTVNAVAQCGTGNNGVVVVPSIVVGNERRAVATCGFYMNAEVVTDVDVTLTIPAIDTSQGQSSIEISASNEAPQPTFPDTIATLTEGAHAAGSTVYSAFDREGSTLSFEIAEDLDSPWMGVTGPLGSYNVVTLADSPELYWRLGEPSGSSVGDASGNGSLGTVEGDPTRGVAGIFGSGGGENTAYRFTGAPDAVSGLNTGLDASTNGVNTVEFWMDWDGYDGTPVALGNADYKLMFADGFFGFRTGGDRGLYGFDAQGLDNEWVHVVAEFHNNDYTSNRLWINDVEQNLHLVLNDTMPVSVPSLGTSLHIGGVSGETYFKGALDEVVLYVGTLGADRIRTHYSYGTGRLVVANAQGRDVVSLYLTAVADDSARVNVEVLDRNAAGDYTFAMRAFDGDKYSTPTTVTGTVTPVQDQPLGVSSGIISWDAYEGGPSVILNLVGADPDDYGWVGYTGGVVRYRITSGPAIGSLYYDSDDGAGLTWTLYNGGTVEFANPSLKYTPEVGPNGDGVFNVSYEVLDAGYPTPAVWSAARVASIFVLNTNDPPTCIDISKTTDEDVDTVIAFACSDPDGDALTYSVVASPAHATLIGSGLQRTFSPDANWNGVTSYTYRAFDGELYSGTQTVTVTVNSVNDAPTTPTGSMPTQNEDVNSTGAFSTTDVDNGPNWTFYISDNATSGFSSTSATLSGKGVLTAAQGSLTDKTATVTFNNYSNWCGSYTYYIKAYDGAAYSGVKTVTGSLTCVNDAPTTPTGSMPTQNEDVNSTGTFTTTDVDNGPNWTFYISASSSSGFSSTSATLSGKGVLTAAQGSLTDKTATVTFNNYSNWCGSYTYYIKAYDGAAYSGVKTVTGSLTCVNDAPATPADAGFVDIIEDQTVSKTYTTSDPDSSRWCMQYKQWSTSTPQPTNAATCPTTVTTSYAYALTGSRGTMTITQGSLTDKTATLTYKPAPNYVTDGTGPTAYVRFCDSDGACGGWQYETFSVLNNHDDLIVITNSADKYRWWLNSTLTGSWTWSPTWEYNADRRPVTGDWDGDGIDNFLIYHTGNGNWYREKSLVTQASINWQTASTNMQVFGGDWDGDGDDDFAYYNNSNGYVYLRDNDSGAVTSWRDTGFMMTGQMPQGGDADGDGTDEVYFWDNDDDGYTTTGTWYIIEPVSNGADVVAPFVYGGCNQCGKALVGDWNANGIETIGYYLESNGEVHARNYLSAGGDDYAQTYYGGYAEADGFDDPNH